MNRLENVRVPVGSLAARELESADTVVTAGPVLPPGERTAGARSESTARADVHSRSLVVLALLSLALGFGTGSAAWYSSAPEAPVVVRLASDATAGNPAAAPSGSQAELPPAVASGRPLPEVVTPVPSARTRRRVASRRSRWRRARARRLRRARRR